MDDNNKTNTIATKKKEFKHTHTQRQKCFTRLPDKENCALETTKKNIYIDRSQQKKLYIYVCIYIILSYSRLCI
jgi:hypothetical protein